MSWTQYFKLKGIKPGRMIVPGYGTIDFADPNLPVELLKSLFENDFQYLAITLEGIESLYPPPISLQPIMSRPVLLKLPAKRIHKRKA